KFDHHHVGNRIDDQQLTAQPNTRKSPAGGVRQPPETAVGSTAMAGPGCRCGESHIALALRACGAVGANVVHPAFWDDLLAVVASALRHHLAKTPEVSQRRVEAGR